MVLYTTEERSENMMKIVFADIDGTFFDMEVGVPTINITAVRALENSGNRFVFVSGRNQQQIEEMLDKYELDCDYIFGNGAGYKLVGETPIYRSFVQVADYDVLEGLLEAENTFYHLHTSNGVMLKPIANYEVHMAALRTYFDALGDFGKMAMDYKENYYRNECEHHENPFGYLKDNPEVKLVKAELMDTDEAKKKRLVESAGNSGFFAYSSYFSNLEILTPETTKGAAIAEYLGLFPKALSYGIGDAENDIAMLKAVDIPVAMGNSTPELLAVAKLVIGDCKDGGLGAYILADILEVAIDS